MTTSEMIDLALRVYRNLGWTILKASALPTLFSLGGFAFLLFYVGPNLFNTDVGTSTNQQILEAMFLIVVGLVVAVPLVLLGVSLITSFVAPLVADFVLGNVPNARAAQMAQIRTSGRMMMVSLREGLLSSSGGIVAGLILGLGAFMNQVMPPGDVTPALVVAIGFFALMIGAVFPLVFASFDALVAPAAALENLGAKAASKRSRELMKNNRIHGSGYEAVWSVYGLLILIAIAIGGGAGTFTGVIDLAGWIDKADIGPWAMLTDAALMLLPWFLIIWICVPVWATTVTILYFERRVRLEGYDIETLAADVWRSDREGRFQL